MPKGVEMAPQVFVSRRIPKVGLDLLLAKGLKVDLWQGDIPPSYDVMMERCQRVDGIISMLSDRMDRKFIHRCPNLKVIANFAVGLDNIDLEAAHEAKIAVGNTPGVLTEATADLAVSLLLASARNVVPGCHAGLQGRWQCWEPLGYLGLDLQGKTLGILGMGRIGEAVARRCAGGWNMRIIYTSRNSKPKVERDLGAQRVLLDQLFQESDFLSIHTDLNSETKGLLDRNAFEKMKPNALIVNTARGAIINTNHLLESIRNQRVWGAALDVTDPEPLPHDHPLWKEPRVLITPHIGSATYTTRDQMAVMAAEHLIAKLCQVPNAGRTTAL